MIMGEDRVKESTWKIVHLAFVILATKELTAIEYTNTGKQINISCTT